MAELYPWQQQLINTMVQYKGRGMVQTTGRNLGKSVMNSQAFQRLWADIHMRPVEDLKLSEGTVYGARYYTVEPVGGNWRDMEEWCGQTFGPGSTEIWQHDMSKAPAPELRWYMNNRKFWFRTEKDRNWFTLRWSRQ